LSSSHSILDFSGLLQEEKVLLKFVRESNILSIPYEENAVIKELLSFGKNMLRKFISISIAMEKSCGLSEVNFFVF
jgi:hypothetical protein